MGFFSIEIFVYMEEKVYIGDDEMKMSIVYCTEWGKKIQRFTCKKTIKLFAVEH